MAVALFMGFSSEHAEISVLNLSNRGIIFLIIFELFFCKKNTS